MKLDQRLLIVMTQNLVAFAERVPWRGNSVANAIDADRAPRQEHAKIIAFPVYRRIDRWRNQRPRLFKPAWP